MKKFTCTKFEENFVIRNCKDIVLLLIQHMKTYVFYKNLDDGVF
jgi:hypothetical protein